MPKRARRSRAILATLTPEQMTRPGALGDWSAKDVLAHLYEWEQMVLGWLAAGQRGQTPSVPARGTSGASYLRSISPSSKSTATAPSTKCSTCSMLLTASNGHHRKPIRRRVVYPRPVPLDEQKCFGILFCLLHQ